MIGQVVKINGRDYRFLMVSSEYFGYKYWPEGPVARALSRFIHWWLTQEWIYEWAMYDRKACGIPMNEVSPWWCVGWWASRPLKIIGYFATTTDPEWMYRRNNNDVENTRRA